MRLINHIAGYLSKSFDDLVDGALHSPQTLAVVVIAGGYLVAKLAGWV